MIIFISRDQIVECNTKNLLISCEIDANPPPTVTWTHNGQPIDENDQRFSVFSQNQEYALIIHDINSNTEGL